MISKKDIIEINMQFGNGSMMNESSLDYAVKTQERSTNWLKTAAVLTRSVLIDHVFEDGNKRTAAAIIMLIMDLNNIEFDPEELPKIIVKILKKNMTSTTNIERCIKDAVR